MLYPNPNPFTPSDSVTVTITLTDGTFDLFDGTMMGRMRCTPIFPVNVMVMVTESLGVKRPSKFPFAFVTSYAIPPYVVPFTDQRFEPCDLRAVCIQ